MAGATVILGGVTLNPSIVWEDRFAFQSVAQTTTRTLAGNLVTFAQGLSKGRPITLVANETRGWLTKSDVEAIQALADAVAATYSLQIDTEFFTVQFRHEDPPAFEARELRDDLLLTDGTFGDPTISYFEATIKLTEV